jgi:hypothetical protein
MRKYSEKLTPLSTILTIGGDMHKITEKLLYGETHETITLCYFIPVNGAPHHWLCRDDV